MRASYEVGVWKAIRKNRHVVTSNISSVVGNGRRVLFWKDKWCGPTPFCVEYPSLFVIATSKDALVSDGWSPGESGGCWNPLFSGPFND